MSCDEERSFTIAKYERGRKLKKRASRPKLRCDFTTGLPVRDIDDELFYLIEEIGKINEKQNVFENSKYLKSTIDILENKSTSQITNIVCFGIGRITRSPTSNSQLAYILALKSYFNIEKIQFHEPVLSKREKNLLKILNCEVYSENVKGKLRLDSSETTLVFLPHCPFKLTNNLLWKNWSASSLNHIILFCNSFKRVISRIPYPLQNAYFIKKIKKYTLECTLKNSWYRKHVFNEMRIHFFNTKSCQGNFFDNCIEPKTRSDELINAICS